MRFITRPGNATRLVASTKDDVQVHGSHIAQERPCGPSSTAQYNGDDTQRGQKDGRVDTSTFRPARESKCANDLSLVEKMSLKDAIHAFLAFVSQRNDDPLI